MTIARKQSAHVPSWATTSTFPAGPDPWAGTPTRVAPSAPLAAAGRAPRDQLPAQWVNYHHGVMLDQLAALVDAPAINWFPAGSTEADNMQSHTVLTYGTLIASAKIGGLGGYYESWMFICDQKPSSGGGTGECFRSRGGAHWELGGAPASFAGQPIDVLGWGSKAVLMTNDGTGKVWFSSNAGATWSAGPFALPAGGGSYDRIAWIQSASLYVAAGGSRLATSADLATWGPNISTSGLGVRHIITPGEDETGVGAVILRNSDELTWTTDGITWTDRTISGASAFAGGCWSEVHQCWFAITETGQLYRAETADASWSQIADLYGPAGTSFLRPAGATMQAWGKNLVILGEQIRVSGGGVDRCGDVLVYDPVNAYGYALNPNPGYDTERPFDRLVRHDGRLVAARTSDYTSPYWVHLAASQRAPWCVE